MFLQLDQIASVKRKIHQHVTAENEVREKQSHFQIKMIRFKTVIAFLFTQTRGEVGIKHGRTLTEADESHET